MQALGFAYSIMPILKKVYPNEDEYFEAIKRHLNFYNTNPFIGSPTIFGPLVLWKNRNSQKWQTASK